MALHDYFIASASRYPGKDAVRESSGASITYRDLDRLTDDLRDRLAHLGMRRGGSGRYWVRRIEGGLE
jgi:non-ribosomal peptide synthetase component E (peptide arylation enzyme)